MRTNLDINGLREKKLLKERMGYCMLEIIQVLILPIALYRTAVPPYVSLSPLHSDHSEQGPGSQASNLMQHLWEALDRGWCWLSMFREQNKPVPVPRQNPRVQKTGGSVGFGWGLSPERKEMNRLYMNLEEVSIERFFFWLVRNTVHGHVPA